MEYARAPLNCLQPAEEYLHGIDNTNAAKSLACTTRKATPADIAALAPKPTLAYDICAEMGLKRKPKKKPEHPYELTLTKEGHARENNHSAAEFQNGRP